MRNETRMRNISTLIKRARSGVTLPYFRVDKVLLFGSAMRGGECRDIDVVVVGRELQPFIRKGCFILNHDIALKRLRHGMKGVEFHPMHDIEAFTGTQVMTLWEAA